MNESQTTITVLDCGICGASFHELVPLSALTNDSERSRCAAIQLPVCLTCEAQAEAWRDESVSHGH